MLAADRTAKSPRTFLLRALAAGIVAALACCGGGQNWPTSPATGGSGSGSGSGSSSSGGGGAGANASPYGLYASSYIAYAGASSAPFLHSVQAGDIYTGSGGNYGYGNYSSPQSAMNSTGTYVIQWQAGATAPTTAADYAYVALLAPGSRAGATPTFDISQSDTLLIQMGNSYVAANNNGLPGGNAKVFTVDLNNTKGSTASTNDCSFDQSLSTLPANVGVRTYAIPLSSFTCTKGNTVAALQSAGITTVAITIVGSKNPNVAPNEYDTIAVGYVGFSGTAPSDVGALSSQ